MPEGRVRHYVIKRQIQKGIHSSTRTVYEYLASQGGVWTEDRIDADTFSESEIDNNLAHFRAMNHRHGRVLCTMKEPA